MLDELFNSNQKTTQKAVFKEQATSVQPTVKPRLTETKIEVDDEIDTVYERISSACGGNPYLECMILGELINSPRSKR